jgi:hypothetical protein
MDNDIIVDNEQLMEDQLDQSFNDNSFEERVSRILFFDKLFKIILI